MSWKDNFIICQELDKRWLEHDIHNMKAIQSLLPPLNKTPKDFVRNLDNCWGFLFDLKQEIGFNAQRICLTLSGYYSGHHIYILSYDDVIVQIDVICNAAYIDPHGQIVNLAEVVKIIEANWGSDLQKVEEGVKYTWVDSQRLSIFYEQIARELGTTEPVNVPENLRGAYETLISPLSIIMFGWDDEIVKFPEWRLPPGREAIEKLKNYSRIDLIRNVLRGPNREGRIYAFESLLEFEREGMQLAVADKIAMDKIRNFQIPLTFHDCYITDTLTTPKMIFLIEAKQYTLKIKKRLNCDPRFSRIYIFLGPLKVPFYKDIEDIAVLKISGILEKQEDSEALKTLLDESQPPIKVIVGLGDLRWEINPN